MITAVWEGWFLGIRWSDNGFDIKVFFMFKNYYSIVIK
jgi:hypothetical protein